MILNTHPENRKEMVKAICEMTGMNATYLFTPTYAYQVGPITVSWDGSIDCEDEAMLSTIKPMLIERGWMEAETQDALIVLGNTNSCLSVISAKRLKIPVFHMEAGNRCFDENLPEEINRRIVDITSDVNLCYTEHARSYLHAMGFPKERTYVVGSPMAEVLSENLPHIQQSKVLETLGLEKGHYILLSAHREENIDIEDNFFALMNAVNAMAETYDVPIIYSMHPRSSKFIAQRGFQFHPNVRSLKPFGFWDYNHLQLNALCVVSDSGTLPEESSYFARKGMPYPAVAIRTSTERPEALDKGDFVIAGITKEQVLQAVDTAISMQHNGDVGLGVPNYMDENVSTKVVKLIQSYTGIVNKMVWRKTKRTSFVDYRTDEEWTLIRRHFLSAGINLNIGSFEKVGGTALRIFKTREYYGYIIMKTD